MNKELRDKLKGKKVHQIWERSLVTWEKCKNSVRSCRDAMRMSKALLELNLAKEIKNNKKKAK